MNSYLSCLSLLCAGIIACVTMTRVRSFSVAMIYVLKQSKAGGGSKSRVCDIGERAWARDPIGLSVLIGQNSETFKHQIQYHATYLAALRQKLWLLVL